MIPPLPLLLFTQSTPSPGLLEIQPEIYVLPGKPGTDALLKARALGITHVIDLRTASEGDFTSEAASFRSHGGVYLNCPVSQDSIAANLDQFRPLLASLPSTARVLVRCASGNRAGGALFAHWVLDQGMPVDEALSLAKRAGLHNPATEKAVREYVASFHPVQGHRRFSRAESD